MEQICLNKIPLVSVIVPVYNEQDTIAEVLTDLLRLKEKMEIDIIVVDDGSTDGTPRILEKFPSVKCVRHESNRGKGAAIRSGVSQSHGNTVVIQDADLEYPPEIIPQIVKPIVDGQADVVYGSRFLGSNEGMSLSHTVGNRILSLTARLLYGVHVTDIMTGHKAFSRESIQSFDLTENGFGVEVQITCGFLRNRLRLLEVPIGYRYRRNGVSKIDYMDGVKCILVLLSERIRKNRMEQQKTSGVLTGSMGE